jgi:hypothetical protein
MDNEVTPATGSGLNVSGGDAIFMDNCDILRFGNGILLAPSAGRRSEWDFFTAVACDTNTNDGIKIGGGGGDVHGVNFVNCWSGSNTNQGLYIGDGAGDLEGIVFSAGKLLANGRNGVQLVSPASRIMLSDNLIAGNSQSSSAGYHGVRVEAGITHLTITENQTWNGLDITATQGYGLSFASGATDYLVITDNDLTGNVTGEIDNLAGVTGTRTAFHWNPWAIWRPVVDGAGAIILDGTGQALMAYGPA